jgi:ABC-type multidrug transport system ATPase subunit
MTYKGMTCTRRVMRQRVSYVIQADRLLPNLTVRETLTYTAYLKLPDNVHKHQLERKVWCVWSLYCNARQKKSSRVSHHFARVLRVKLHIFVDKQIAISTVTVCL